MFDVQRFPLKALKVAPENARATYGGDVSSLALSIASAGLIDPLHGYADGKAVMIEDGGRRLRALAALAKDKALPADLSENGVPVVIWPDRESARLRSQVSFVREGLHPAAEFRQYKALFDEGRRSPDEIGAACGVDARRVAQLLKLADVHPDILAAFEAGRLDLGAVEAFTVATDQAAQLAAYALAADRHNLSRSYIRSLLRAGQSCSPGSAKARLVGREAYEAAGGRVAADLFAVAPYEDAETWLDGALVERLAGEKLAALADTLKADGWSDVRVIEPNDAYGWNNGLQRVGGEAATLTDDEAARFEELAERFEGFEPDDAEPLDDDDAAAWAELCALDAKAGAVSYTAEQKAVGVAAVILYGDGTVSFETGWEPRRKAVKAKGAAAEGEAEGDGEADAAVFGWGHTGHWHLTHIASAATRHALLKKPDAALDVLTASLAWDLVAPWKRTALRIEAKGAACGVIPAEARIPGEAAWIAKRDAWRARIPADDFANCLAYVAALPKRDKAELLALCVGLGVDGVEARFDQRGGSWASLAAMATHAGVNVADAWQPDETFLKKGSKAALLSALADTGDASALTNAKKGELVGTMLGRLKKGATWVPALLRSLVTAPAAAEAIPPLAAE